MKLTLNVVEDLRKLADSLEILAGSVIEPHGAGEEEVIEPATSQEEKPKITFEDLRAVLSRDGKREKVKELIEKYGAKKLPDVPEEHYHELLEEARKI